VICEKPRGSGVRFHGLTRNIIVFPWENPWARSMKTVNCEQDGPPWTQTQAGEWAHQSSGSRVALVTGAHWDSMRRERGFQQFSPLVEDDWGATENGWWRTSTSCTLLLSAGRWLGHQGDELGVKMDSGENTRGSGAFYRVAERGDQSEWGRRPTARWCSMPMILEGKRTRRGHKEVPSWWGKGRGDLALRFSFNPVWESDGSQEKQRRLLSQGGRRPRSWAGWVENLRGLGRLWEFSRKNGLGWQVEVGQKRERLHDKSFRIFSRLMGSKFKDSKYFWTGEN
jgi:hypothetical protein